MRYFALFLSNTCRYELVTLCVDVEDPMHSLAAVVCTYMSDLAYHPHVYTYIPDEVGLKDYDNNQNNPAHRLQTRTRYTDLGI